MISTTPRPSTLVDADVRTGLGLDLLDHTATGADHGTDALFRDLDGDDARCVLLVIGAGRIQHLVHLTQDVQAAHTGLLQGLGQHFVGKAVHLHVHLGGGHTFRGAADLEVHVAQEILVAEDVAEDRVARCRR
jgi:hypothetical protein